MSLLDKIENSKQIDFTDLKIMIYGSPAIGKSTFASHPDYKPIYIDLEDGLHAIKAPRFPRATSFKQFNDQLSALKKDKHDYETIVIDSLDWLEKLIEQQVCEDYKSKSVLDISFGRGYSACRAYISQVLETLDSIPMMKVFIAHESIKTIHSPLYEPYDKILPKLNEKISSLFAEYCDIIGYMTFRLTIKKGEGFEKSKAIGQGDRVLYLNEKPSFLAKNRFGLPDKIEPKIKTLIDLTMKSIEKEDEDLPDFMK